MTKTLRQTARRAAVLFLLLGISDSPFAEEGGSIDESTQAAPAIEAKLPAVTTARPGPPAIDMERAITLSGRVVDQRSRPVAGARLFLSVDSWNDPVELGTADSDGVYRLEVPERSFHRFMDGSPTPNVHAWLIAVADGYGPAWANLPGVERDGWEAMQPGYDRELRLVPDAPIAGRVVDANGKPVAGAEVAVAGIHKLSDPRWFKMPAAIEANDVELMTRGEANVNNWKLPLHRSSWRMLPPAVTDADGRFLLAGVGRDRAAKLAIEGPGVNFSYASVLTRDDAEDFTRGMRAKHASLRLYGPQPLIDIERAPTVAGTVRDAVTGEPLAGVRIVVKNGRKGYPVSTHTDRRGWYRVRREASRDPVDVSALPWDDQETYLPVVRRFDGSAEPNEIVADFALPHGVVVTGRVVEAGTDRPILSAARVTCDAPYPGTLRTGHVWYYPLAMNTALGQSPTGLYLADFPARRSNHWLLEPIDPDGRFRIAVPPGPGVLLVKSSPGVSGNYLLMHSDVPSKESEGLHLLSPYTPLTKREANDGVPAGTAETFDGINGPIRIEGFHAYRVISPPADAKELKLTLHVPRAPSRLLRFVGPNGDAVENVRVQGLTAKSLMTIAIDDAEIEIVGLDPNQPRQVTAISGDGRLVARTFVGVDDEQPTTIRMEPAAALTGRLLDAATNQSLDGYWVTVGYPDPDSDDPRRPRPLARPLTEPVKTDADGRFQIGGLFPDLAVTVTFRAPRRPAFLHPHREFQPESLAGLVLDAGEIRDVEEIRVDAAANRAPSEPRP